MLKQVSNKNRLYYIASCFAFASVMQGCSFTSEQPCYLDAEGYYQNCDNIDSDYADTESSTNQSFTASVATYPTTTNTVGSLHFKLLDEYAEQMALQLADGVNRPIRRGIAVASFVYLDSGLQSAGALGNQFSETLIHELQRYGLPIVDTKVSNAIKVTDTGDFAFSRKVSELSNEQPYTYVLAGTMLRESRGVLVQSRIINVRNKQVIATAAKFIPNLIVNSLVQ